MRRRRHSSQTGFALAEALVALSVAAVTLALLTSATWGLRQTTLRVEVLQEDATDWLTARRVLQAWAASATTAGYNRVEGRFAASPFAMRLIVDDGTSREARPMMVSLEVMQEEGLYRLSAARQYGVRDVRLAAEITQQSTVIVSDAPLRLVYLVARSDDLPGQVWTYEPRPAQGLPVAVAVEQGDERMIVARVPVTRSAACISRLGESGLGDRDCRLR